MAHRTAKPFRLRRVLLIAGASILMLVGCGTSSGPTPTTAAASTTAAPVTTGAMTTASGAPPRSQLLPDVALPAGSTSSGITNGIEAWNVPASWGAQSRIIEHMRTQLPLSKPYNGLPWCNESETNFKTHSLQWSWDDGQHYIRVDIGGQTVTIQSLPDDPTWGGCAAPAHSALANVDLPTGSQLSDTTEPGMEAWTVLINYLETVEWLRQRLPVYGDYQGLKWCQDGSGSDYTEWQWGDSRELFDVHVAGSMVTFTRGPDPYGCVA